ncbi:MAG: RNA polymerase sigma factor [Myxococcota bacterium]
MSAATKPAATEHSLPFDDPEGLGELLRGLEPRLRAVALRMTRDRDAAADVVQAAFEKALRYGRDFRGTARVSTWLHRIVINEALMWLRSERRHHRHVVELDEGRGASLEDPAPRAPELLAQRQQVLRVRAGLAALRPEDRDVLERCALQGRSYAEVGRRTGTHPAALKSRAFRARRQLSRLLQNS